jgi:hypothetical protein
MARGVNKAIILGTLGRDPDVSTPPVVAPSLILALPPTKAGKIKRPAKM